VKDYWWLPTARPLPVAPTRCLRSVCRPDDLHHLLDTGERVTSFPRDECFHSVRVLLVLCAGGDRLHGDAHGRVQSGREMTPRSHAFCRPSPRTPCGGVASFEARTVRVMAQGLGGGREPGGLLPRAAWAEHRGVKGMGTGMRAKRSRRSSCSPPRHRCSNTLCRRCPGSRRSGDRDHRACFGQGCLRFRIPAKGAGCRAARVLGSFRKYVNERGIAPAARPTDLRSRGLPVRVALRSDRPAPFLTTGTRPNLTGEARLLWLGRCPRESFPWNPVPRLSFWLVARVRSDRSA
jgi:hypothetical protein